MGSTLPCFNTLAPSSLSYTVDFLCELRVSVTKARIILHKPQYSYGKEIDFFALVSVCENTISCSPG